MLSIFRSLIRQGLLHFLHHYCFRCSFWSRKNHMKVYWKSGTLSNFYMISESSRIFWDSSRIFGNSSCIFLSTPSSATEDASPWRSSRCRAFVISWRVMWPLQQLPCRDLVNWRIWSARTWLLVPEQLTQSTWRSLEGPEGHLVRMVVLPCECPLLGWSTCEVEESQESPSWRTGSKTEKDGDSAKGKGVHLQKLDICRTDCRFLSVAHFSFQLPDFREVWHRASEHERKAWWCLPNLCAQLVWRGHRADGAHPAWLGDRFGDRDGYVLGTPEFHGNTLWFLQHSYGG